MLCIYFLYFQSFVNGMQKFIVVLFLLLAGCVQPVENNVVSECVVNEDCVPSSCCHSSSCVSKNNALDCRGMFCTQVCDAGTLDCGGSCACEAKKCVAKNLYVQTDEIPIL